VPTVTGTVTRAALLSPCGRAPWASAVDSRGQRAGVHGSRSGRVGPPAGSEDRVHPFGQASGKRIHRELQRTAAGGVLESALVPGSGGRPPYDRSLADQLQHQPAAQRPRGTDTGGVRENEEAGDSNQAVSLDLDLIWGKGQTRWFRSARWSHQGSNACGGPPGALLWWPVPEGCSSYATVDGG